MKPERESVTSTRRWHWILAMLALGVIVTVIAYKQTSRERKPASTDLAAEPSSSDKTSATGEVVVSGRELYLQHCAACHGENGNGQGVAAVHLYPKPRDFQAGRFRLLSTGNRVPSQQDLLAVIDRGMPGSSMPPWAHLPETERLALVEEVQRLHREGTRIRYIRLLKEEQALTDEEIAAEDVQQEIAEYVAEMTAVGEPLAVPPIGPADEASIARGKDHYSRNGCNKCHGDQGRGDATMKMLDDEGYPTTARDFSRGIFKGGHDASSLYRRILFGMPGTPMPRSTITPSETIDLVNFILSLSDETARQEVIQRRVMLTVRRLEKLPQDASEEAWSSIATKRIRLVPLWWRNEAHPELQVQAAHDTQTLALRLVWNDPTHDDHAAQSAAFKDAVAVELYQGAREPFVGMGARGTPVDVWFWDADRSSPTDIEERNPRVVVDMYPFSEQAVATAEYQREGTRRDKQPELSLPALASGNQITPNGGRSGGSGLSGAGPGTVTFRIPKNQMIQAQGQWADGRWTVTMQRPLAVKSPAEGVSLASGERVSIAFAVWNGAMKDRDGQKLVSIWNDLELE